ncbi:hypothetical protein BOO86_27615 [Mycobacterium sp. CBMA 234]|uniref:hypothetical protein n=1 Tax=Mycolicibacterium sp. CBMA 234 TaxID=1918495 RepID=UPI0012DF4990|nr:hypothetical protein [Mycolicibacterium sp. CBMA 234]MUL68268.1 hypothetical protein [Mycolicibacterium sp. CBMA 234]
MPLLVAGLLTATTLAPPSAAQPQQFPDLNAFAEAPSPSQYSRPDKWANGYMFFSTPDGVNCMIGATRTCYGNLPGLTPDQLSACSSVKQDDSSAPFRFNRSDQPCAPVTDAPLKSGYKLTFDARGTTCVVGQDRLTACIDSWHNHGFVLQPSGSWTF